MLETYTVTARHDADGWDWPLPAEPYVPGQTARPAGDDDVHRIARAAPKPIDPDRWADNVAWLAGLRLYRAGYYWEAHEVWEAVWMNAKPNSRERLMVQGVIQIANAALKQKMGRQAAAQRLIALALGLVADARGDIADPVVMGVDLAVLSEALAGRLMAGKDHTLASPFHVVSVAPTLDRSPIV